jgi:hypothetical protein
MWPSTFGLAATLAVGLAIASVARTRPTADALALAWYEVMRRREPEAAAS